MDNKKQQTNKRVSERGMDFALAFVLRHFNDFMTDGRNWRTMDFDGFRWMGRWDREIGVWLLGLRYNKSRMAFARSAVHGIEGLIQDVMAWHGMGCDLYLPTLVDVDKGRESQDPTLLK